MRRPAPRRLLAIAAIPLLGGCIATSQQVQQLQDEVRTMRSEAAVRDSLVRQRLGRELDSVRTTVSLLRDSLLDFRAYVTRTQGQVLGDLGSVREGLIEVRQLTGQSQSRIVELRAELEQRNTLLQQQPAPSAGGTTPPSPSPTAAAPAAPGPSQLYTMALDQLRRGSTAAARAAFTDFLAQYPSHAQAGDAQYYLAETLERDNKGEDAEAAYLATYSKYASSPKAPTAMFKRATLLEKQGKAPRAREVLEALVKSYPRSDEAELARDRLKG
ncbi:MAG: tol-pal system protein YbgF [Gemmatimonadaceae bacterium]|nr:tol-pal system protein YbgF [Gemmatimonadaceae bacterium]